MAQYCSYGKKKFCHWYRLKGVPSLGYFSNSIFCCWVHSLPNSNRKKVMDGKLPKRIRALSLRSRKQFLQNRRIFRTGQKLISKITEEQIEVLRQAIAGEVNNGKVSIVTQFSDCGETNIPSGAASCPAAFQRIFPHLSQR